MQPLARWPLDCPTSGRRQEMNNKANILAVALFAGGTMLAQPEVYPGAQGGGYPPGYAPPANSQTYDPAYNQQYDPAYGQQYDPTYDPTYDRGYDQGYAD